MTPPASLCVHLSRAMGIFATIEELWAGEPEELEGMRAAVIARAARRRAAASAAGSRPGLQAQPTGTVQ